MRDLTFLQPCKVTALLSAGFQQHISHLFAPLLLSLKVGNLSNKRVFQTVCLRHVCISPSVCLIDPMPVCLPRLTASRFSQPFSLNSSFFSLLPSCSANYFPPCFLPACLWIKICLALVAA